MIRKLPNIKLDLVHSIPARGSTFYLMEDGFHVVEVELMDSPVRISCRFTLCHPPSIDTAFLAFVHELMSKLGVEAVMKENVRPEHCHAFSLDNFGEFSSIALGYIAQRRAEWIAEFGTEQIPASTIKVHEQIILPRCQSTVQHQG